MMKDVVSKYSCVSHILFSNKPSQFNVLILMTADQYEYIATAQTTQSNTRGETVSQLSLTEVKMMPPIDFVLPQPSQYPFSLPLAYIGTTYF